MTLLQLIDRSLRQRVLSSTLTAASVALGVMLVSAILVVQAELENTFLSQGRGYDLVVGPNGSPLQIVLNSIYHIDQSPGLIPYGVQRELGGEKNRRYIRLAVPYAVGDSFHGYRVVATTDGIFSKYFPFPPGEGKEKLRAGRPFRFEEKHLDEAFAAIMGRGGPGSNGASHDGEVNEAVLGHAVAERLGIDVGDHIEPTHGVEGDDKHAHAAEWEVTGVLKRTGTPLDRVVFINLDSFYRISEHRGALIPDTGEPAISSILLFPRPGHAKAYLLPSLRKRTEFQVADVATEIKNLLGIVGNVDRIFLLVAILVVVLGVVSVMVAIYNTMNERRREMAIMRAIGARRATIMATVVGEAAALSFSGAVVGVVLGHLLILAAAGYVERVSGMVLPAFRVLPGELLIVLIVTVAGALAGLIPAWKAYRTDVARHLAPLS